MNNENTNQTKKYQAKCEIDEKKKPVRERTDEVRKEAKTKEKEEAEQNISTALTGEIPCFSIEEELPAIPVLAEGFTGGEKLKPSRPDAAEASVAQNQIKDGRTTPDSQKQSNVNNLTRSVLAKNVLTFLSENVPKLTKKFADKVFELEDETDIAATSGSDTEPRSAASETSEQMDVFSFAIDGKNDRGLLNSEEFYREVEEIFQRNFREDRDEGMSGGILPCFLSELFLSNLIDSDWPQPPLLSSTET